MPINASIAFVAISYSVTVILDLDWARLQTYVRGVIDVVVQLERRGGQRRVAEVSFFPRGRAATKPE